MEEIGNLAETAISLFGGRKRRLTSALTKRRLSQEAKANVTETRQEITGVQADLKALETDKAQMSANIHERWAKIVTQADETPLVPMKKDIFLDLFGVAWLPYYVVGEGSSAVEVPAFKAS